MNSLYGLGMNDVEYRRLSHLQKRECLWCSHDATQEAFLSEGNLTAIIRCCNDPKCMQRALEMCEHTVGAA